MKTAIKLSGIQIKSINKKATKNIKGGTCNPCYHPCERGTHGCI